MRTILLRMIPLAALLACLPPQEAPAGVTVFFSPSQQSTLISTNATSDTISSEGYVFTYTRDKLFTGGGTNRIGRPVRIPWPDGLEAQYVTAGPNPGKAKITIRRADGAVFDLAAFTAHLLANAGAGRAIEIVPLLGGEEPLGDPLYFDVSGNYGNEFSYDSSPNYLGSTAALTNYDTYVISLTLDYALTALTLESAAPNINHPPADLAVSSASVVENMPIGTVVGTLCTTDPDYGDTFTYALVAGAGSEDNALFSVIGSNLVTATSLNYEVRSTCSVRVQATDQGLLSTERVFAITVLDIDETPVFLGLEARSGNSVVLTWCSVTNHLYSVYFSTNLLTGFSLAGSKIMATPVMNVYTGSTLGAPVNFWRVSTEP